MFSVGANVAVLHTLVHELVAKKQKGVKRVRELKLQLPPDVTYTIASGNNKLDSRMLGTSRGPVRGSLTYPREARKRLKRSKDVTTPEPTQKKLRTMWVCFERAGFPLRIHTIAQFCNNCTS